MNDGKLIEHAKAQSKVFWESLENETDRALGIIAVCWMDDLLQKLIRTAYINNPQVKTLFKNDHLLQTFYSKVSIAYFSGLIPSYVYHDLKLIGEIRNRFAHQVAANLKFDDKAIAQRIDRCELRPRSLDDMSAYRLKFIIVAQLLGTLLAACELLLSKLKPPKLMELVNLEEIPYEDMALTKTEIAKIIMRGRQSTGIDSNRA